MRDINSVSVPSPNAAAAATFTGISIFPLTETVIDGTSEVWPTFGRPIGVFAELKTDKQGAFVEFYRVSEPSAVGDKAASPFRRCYLHLSQVVKVGPTLQIWAVDESHAEGLSKMTSFGLQFTLQKGNDSFYSALLDHKVDAVKQEVVDSNEDSVMTVSKFEKKIEPSSAKMYFHYYGQLLHQQNMMQDYVRTGTYYAAVIENHADFHGKVVVDVGAGSGILSLFAAQAGAKHVYAVEASAMAEYARKLVAGNHPLSQRITVRYLNFDSKRTFFGI
jgi:hypothetical protein